MAVIHWLGLLLRVLRVLCGRSQRSPRFKMLMGLHKHEFKSQGARTAVEDAEIERGCQGIFNLVEIWKRAFLT